MDILNSSWLVGMLEKSAPSPQQRLLNLFDILDDWLHAPNIRAERLSGSAVAAETPPALLPYLTEQCTAIRAQAPDALAYQLYCMVVAAFQQELHTPHCGSLQHARQAAQALIGIQLAPHKPWHTRYSYALAASVTLIALLSSYLTFTGIQHETPVLLQVQSEPIQPTNTIPVYLNPAHTAEMFASIERMRGGTCHYPEALMLPENQRSVYMRNVVGGEISADAKERALAIELLQQVQCHYAPMLMKNSTG